MESKLLAQNKNVVVPGQPLAEGMDYLPSFGTYRIKDKILAQQVGLLMVEGKVLKTIPLAGRYLPKVGDTVIGKVVDILMSGWRLDINSPYSAVLPLKDASSDYIRKGEDLTTYFDLEEYVLMKITQVTSQNLIDTTARGPGLQKLEGGRIVSVNTFKIPRIIGKRGSMVNLIKEATGCDVAVGQNGLVWIKGRPKDEVLAYKTIKMIEDSAHVPGLTENIKEYLEEETGKSLELKEQQPQEQGDARGGDHKRPAGPKKGGRGPHKGPKKGPRR